ncbi:hypothetical protein ON010_g17795 [Phytophthora cinnamomi]|nr:hypothetical protein ON010_g17795 [Phytophthora cinnamomi]
MSRTLVVVLLGHLVLLDERDVLEAATPGQRERVLVHDVQPHAVLHAVEAQHPPVVVQPREDRPVAAHDQQLHGVGLGARVLVDLVAQLAHGAVQVQPDVHHLQLEVAVRDEQAHDALGHVLVLPAVHGRHRLELTMFSTKCELHPGTSRIESSDDDNGDGTAGDLGAQGVRRAADRGGRVRRGPGHEAVERPRRAAVAGGAEAAGRVQRTSATREPPQLGRDVRGAGQGHAHDERAQEGDAGARSGAAGCKRAIGAPEAVRPHPNAGVDGACYALLLERASGRATAGLHAAGGAVDGVPRLPARRYIRCGLGWNLSPRERQTYRLDDLNMTLPVERPRVDTVTRRDIANSAVPATC